MNKSCYYLWTFLVWRCDVAVDRGLGLGSVYLNGVNVTRVCECT